MKIFNIINKTPSIIYLNNENWIFKNEIDKNWFGIHVFMYSCYYYCLHQARLAQQKIQDYLIGKN